MTLISESLAKGIDFDAQEGEAGRRVNAFMRVKGKMRSTQVCAIMSRRGRVAGEKVIHIVSDGVPLRGRA